MSPHNFALFLSLNCIFTGTAETIEFHIGAIGLLHDAHGVVLKLSCKLAMCYAMGKQWKERRIAENTEIRLNILELRIKYTCYNNLISLIVFIRILTF